MITDKSIHDIRAKFVPLNPEKHLIQCYIKQDQRKKYEVNGKWKIYQNSLDITWIMNLSEFPIRVESTWLRTNEEKQLFGGERITFSQENKDSFDYVFCLTNGQSQNSLKRPREDENSEFHTPPEKFTKMATVIQEEIICPICLGILTKCATLNPCGHNFCGLCLIEHLKNSTLCPLCKMNAISVIKHSAFHNIIKAAAVVENSLNNSIVTLQKYLQGNIYVSENLIFIGSFANTLAEGQGTLIGQNNVISQGIWRNGFKKGEGVLIYRDERIVHGFWESGVMQPQVEIHFANGDLYEGETKDLKLHGKGIFRYQTGDIYDGNWKEGVKQGFGKLIWHFGVEYEGDWERGLMNGYGIMKDANGDIYEGLWKEGKREGEGVFTLKNGGKIEALWVNGKLQPFVKFRYINGQIYQGEIKVKELQKHGKGVLIFKDGSRYEGYWVNDKFHGSGKYTCKKDGKVYEEIWERGVLKYSSEKNKY